MPRTLITTPTTWYVSNSGGNDNNDGSTPSLAFATLDTAFDRVLKTCDFAAQPTFQLAASSTPYPRIILPGYAGDISYAGRIGKYDYAFPRIMGDPRNNAAVLLSPAPVGEPTIASCMTKPWVIQSLKIESTDSWAIEADARAVIYTRHVNFGNCSGGHMVAAYGGFIETLYDKDGPYAGGMDITGSTNGGYHMLANYGGMIVAQGNLVRTANSPRFAWFAGANNHGHIEAGGYTFAPGARIVSDHPETANVDASTFGIAHATAGGWS